MLVNNVLKRFQGSRVNLLTGRVYRASKCVWLLLQLVDEALCGGSGKLPWVIGDAVMDGDVMGMCVCVGG